MGAKRAATLRPDWLSKTAAGAVLGFLLALGGSGLFVLATPDIVIGARVQLAMWLFMPLWLGVWSLVYLFGSGARAWLWLGGITLLLYALLAFAQLT